MKTIQQDLKFNILCLDEAINMAQNRPLWRLMSTFGAYALLVVRAIKEEESFLTSSFDAVG